MNPKEPLLPRVLARLRMMRYRWFGRAPTLEEWESRLERVVSETVAQSLRWIPEHGGSFVDVGANVGIYAERVLRDRPDARAWLFEPVRAHYERCRDRFRGNPNVVVEHLALGDASGPTTIWKPKHNPGGNVIDEEIVERRRGFMDFRPEAIECRVFADYAREHGIDRVDFVKSDTEGYDYRVLRGMLPFLGPCEPRPVILAELLREDIHPDFAGQLDVLERMYALGYHRVDLDFKEDVQDFLFVPEGRQAVCER